MTELRRRNDRLMAVTLKVCTAAIVLLMIALVVMLIQGFQKNAALSHSNIALNRATKALKLIPKVEYNACHRLNIQRASTNRNNYADYNAEVQSYNFDILEVKLVRASLSQQTASTPRTLEQRRLTERFIQSLQKAARGVQDAARAKEWTALTDCNEATYSLNYIPPEPIHFATQAAPVSALKLGPHN